MTREKSIPTNEIIYTQRADLSSDSIDHISQIESDRANAHVQLSNEND